MTQRRVGSKTRGLIPRRSCRAEGATNFAIKECATPFTTRTTHDSPCHCPSEKSLSSPPLLSSALLCSPLSSLLSPFLLCLAGSGGSGSSRSRSGQGLEAFSGAGMEEMMASLVDSEAPTDEERGERRALSSSPLIYIYIYIS